jgi:hypothetical protein
MLLMMSVHVAKSMWVTNDIALSSVVTLHAVVVPVMV